jgi:hypothetical protein
MEATTGEAAKTFRDTRTNLNQLNLGGQTFQRTRMGQFQ